jgi:hypothetical protein
LEVKKSLNVNKLKGTHQLLVYADDVNKLGGSVHTIKHITSKTTDSIPHITNFFSKPKVSIIINNQNYEIKNL